MKRLQNGKVVDYDPFSPEVIAETFGVPDGSVAEILDWVGDDPERAQEALEAELAKESPRSTLVDKLS